MAIKKVKDVAKEAMATLKKYQSGELQPVRTGREWLDGIFGGLLPQDIVTIAGASGCVDKDTEFFNGKKWKKISDYEVGDKVLQYNKDGTAELVTPSEYIKKSESTFYHIKSQYGINQMVSLEHDIVYTVKGKIYKKSVSEFLKQHNKSKHGFSSKFITTFDYKFGNKEIEEFRLRLLISIQADGHYCNPSFYDENNTTQIRFRLKKEDKKKRLEYLLEKNKIKYDKRDVSHQKGAKGFHDYSFRFDENVKEFPEYFYDLNKKCMETIYEEASYWDSGQRGKRLYIYYSNSKNNADFIQFMFSSLGFRSTIKEDKHRENINYVVYQTKRNLCGISEGNGIKKEIPKVPSKDGYKYCFTVPSGMLVLRREGSINITGNSGKTFELQRIKNYIMNKENNPNADKYVWLDNSLEMRLLSNIIRDLNINLEKSKKKILTEEFTREEIQLVNNYYKQIADGRFFIDEEAVTPEEFEKVTRNFLEQHKDKETVFIAMDHIALQKNSTGGEKKGAIDGIVESINRLKKEFPNAIWLILSQLNRKILGRIKDKDIMAMPNREDLFSSDVMYHISDYLYICHNPFRMGINEFSRVNSNQYDYLEEHFTEIDKKGKTSFQTLGKMFYIALKIREADVVFNDIFIEDVDIPNIEKYKNQEDSIMGEMFEPDFDTSDPF